MVLVCSIGNMFDHSTLEHRSGFDALADQPGQVDGSINTNGRELLRIIDPWSQLLVGNWFELCNSLAYICIFISTILTYIRHNVFVPGVWLGQFREPFTSIRLLIFFTIVDESALILVRIAGGMAIAELHIPRK